MNAKEQLQIKRALEVLDTVATGLPKGPLFDQVERMTGEKIPQGDRQLLISTMIGREWIYDFTNKLTGNVMLCITEAGRVAMMGL